MKILGTLFLCLTFSAIGFSQTIDQQVTAIRTIYAETNKRIEDGLKNKSAGFHYAAWTVGGKDDAQQWAVVGSLETRDEIWFDGGEPGAGEEGEKARIRKIVSVYKGAADLHSRSEYFFNDAGQLIFTFSSGDTNSGGGKPIERRFYYAQGKLIRVTIGTVNTDAKFSDKDLENAQTESANAAKLQKRYITLLSEIQ